MWLRILGLLLAGIVFGWFLIPTQVWVTTIGEVSYFNGFISFSAKQSILLKKDYDVFHDTSFLDYLLAASAEPSLKPHIYPVLCDLEGSIIDDIWLQNYPRNIGNARLSNDDFLLIYLLRNSPYDHLEIPFLRMGTPKLYTVEMLDTIVANYKSNVIYEAFLKSPASINQYSICE